VKDLSHEDLSLLMMDGLNGFMGGRLDTANKIFRNDHPKKFLHQLVSSQLDVDRLDYLSRDSFFTGVAEGVINTDRIIKMLTVVDDQLAVEGKGIYSIEKFIISRRLMYWQVYLHKTVVAAEYMLVNILKRAKELAGRPQMDRGICKARRLRHSFGHQGMDGPPRPHPGLFMQEPDRPPPLQS
jgi:HD superfamily phosphohydrolase